MSGVLGRTNWAAPPVWYRVEAEGLAATEALIDALPIGSVVAIDGPVVGHACRDRELTRLFDLGFDYESAMNSNHAVDLVSARLMQAMALAGAPLAHLVVLPVREGRWGGQVEGALRALEGARQDGVVEHIGLRVAGPWHVVEPVWARHDAFEFVLTPAAMLEDVAPFALARRVGVVVEGDTIGGQVRLVTVATKEGLREVSAVH
ncbi:MAG: hypothetical protein JSS65_12830 [Armatimonadetes bacterium]|nr:hypothetical protein [Armatimonadota bacterium]